MKKRPYLFRYKLEFVLIPTKEVAYRKLLSVTSLVILDIKEIDPDKHLWLTGRPLEPILGFARLTADVEVPHLGSSRCSPYDYR